MPWTTYSNALHTSVFLNDPSKVFAHADKSLIERFGPELPSVWLLMDPNNHELKVTFHRMNNGGFLKEGLQEMRKCYGLQSDSWVVIHYMGEGYFKIRIYDEEGKEIAYSVQQTHSADFDVTLSSYQSKASQLDSNCRKNLNGLHNGLDEDHRKKFARKCSIKIAYLAKFGPSFD
ncbi:hypothetical protein RJT34_19949 [Clitoria ternatea]|uniref:Uncharacterized protein n=1 Tax=Clitoria ternatea TaxID=43366 RepID=A0AAN9IRY6_CLITE